MFGNFGPYEAWFIPTHAAAIQLGRFYKNVSTDWCISTDEPRYFNKNYQNYEFVFLISDDKSLKDKQKLALQIYSKIFELEGIWDISDENIINDIEQFEEDIIDDVLVEFKKLNRSRNDDITKALINKYEEELRKNTDSIVNNILKNVSIIEKDTIPDKYKKYLTNVVIPNNVKSIGFCAFYNFKSLISIIIPNSVMSIDDRAFFDCKSLTSITIPDSVTSIGKDVFKYCDSLKSITIPDGVTSISNCAFSNCKSLKEIIIPNSVTSIDIQAFYKCKSLKQVVFSSNSPLLNDIKNGEYKEWELELEQIFIKK